VKRGNPACGLPCTLELRAGIRSLQAGRALASYSNQPIRKPGDDKTFWKISTILLRRGNKRKDGLAAEFDRLSQNSNP
jgi:hypothetical protein